MIFCLIIKLLKLIIIYLFKVCTSNCEICSSLTTCSSCSNPFYKVTPANVSCSTCNGIGEAKGDLEKICVICVTKCLICDSLSTCQKCMEGYFLLNPSKCIPQKQIHANLETTFNPSIFNLIFNQAWSTFFEKIKDFLIIEITNVDKKDYNFIASVDRTGVTVKLTFEFNSIIKDDDIMNLTINYTDSPNDEYVLTNKIFTISMIPFCLLPTTYLISNF